MTLGGGLLAGGVLGALGAPGLAQGFNSCAARRASLTWTDAVLDELVALGPARLPRRRALRPRSRRLGGVGASGVLAGQRRRRDGRERRGAAGPVGASRRRRRGARDRAATLVRGGERHAAAPALPRGGRARLNPSAAVAPLGRDCFRSEVFQEPRAGRPGQLPRQHHGLQRLPHAPGLCARRKPLRTASRTDERGPIPGGGRTFPLFVGQHHHVRGARPPG